MLINRFILLLLPFRAFIIHILSGHNASINVKPEGGGGGGPRAYVGHLTFPKNFWSNSHCGEVISLKYHSSCVYFANH